MSCQECVPVSPGYSALPQGTAGAPRCSWEAILPVPDWFDRVDVVDSVRTSHGCSFCAWDRAGKIEVGEDASGGVLP